MERKKRTARKKAYGEGGIYADPKKPNSYIVKIPTGDGKYVTRRAATRPAAEATYQRLKAARDEGLNPTDARQTLQAFVAAWWERSIVKRDLAPKTKMDYKSTLELYVLPTWGNHRLDQFDAPMVIKMFYAIQEEHSTALAHRSLTKLHMVFDAARRWKLIRDNPVADARKDLPAQQAPEKQPLTLAQTRNLFVAVEGHRTELFYHFSLTLGTRPAETLGLLWIDVAPDCSSVTIKRQIQEIGGKRHEREATKTAAGKRTIPIPPRLRQRMQDARRRAASRYVFPNGVGKGQTPNAFSRSFRGGNVGGKLASGERKRIIGIRAKAGLPDTVSLHTFRHTVATRLMELGVPKEIRNGILGHGASDISERYAHALEGSMLDALSKLEVLLHGDL